MLLNRANWTKANYPIAVKLTAGTGLFPETLLAIAIVESQGRVKGAWFPGAGLVARKANNFFGIKEGVNWNGPTMDLPTPGDADKTSRFRVYSNWEESAADFVKFLQANRRYRAAGVFSSPNYQEQILAIARAGYAEAPNYADIITKVADSVSRAAKNVTKIIGKGAWTVPVILAGIFFLTLRRDEKIF
jgi:flagellum-specific peptidoglycan hydrolase FlgJ